MWLRYSVSCAKTSNSMERKVILHLFEMLLCLYDRSNVTKDILEAVLCKMSGPAALPLLFSS